MKLKFVLQSCAHRTDTPGKNCSARWPASRARGKGGGGVEVVLTTVGSKTRSPGSSTGKQSRAAWGGARTDGDAGGRQQRSGKKTSMAPSVESSSGRGVCSKSAAATPAVPFPPSTRPDDDHSSYAITSNFRPRMPSPFFRNIREEGARGEQKGEGKTRSGDGERREKGVALLGVGERRGAGAGGRPCAGGW